MPITGQTQTERHYHVVFYLVFSLLGQYIDNEIKIGVKLDKEARNIGRWINGE